MIINQTQKNSIICKKNCDIERIYIKMKCSNMLSIKHYDTSDIRKPQNMIVDVILLF